MYSTHHSTVSWFLKLFVSHIHEFKWIFDFGVISQGCLEQLKLDWYNVKERVLHSPMIEDWAEVDVYHALMVFLAAYPRN